MTFLDSHAVVRDVVEAVPLSDLRWSLICVAMMVPSKPAYSPVSHGPGSSSKENLFGLLQAPHPHNLLLKADSPPAWENTWLVKIPWIGHFLNIFAVMFSQYKTKLEDVADFLAGDLASGSDEWVGKKVGMKDKAKIKTA